MRALLLACAALAALPAAAQTSDVSGLARLWAGEWNNNEQVWQQKIDAAAKPGAPVAEHVHAIVLPFVSAPLGGQLLFVQRSRGDNLAEQRRPLLLRLVPVSDGAVRAEPLAFADPAAWLDGHRRPQALQALAPADVKPEAPGCTITLRPEANAWAGRTAPGQCPGGDRSLRIAEDRWDAASGGALPLSSRKVRYYEGWFWFRDAGPQSTPDDKKTHFTRRVLIHNEGQRVPVLKDDGTPTPWLVELAVLTYQNTRRPILKLALVDAASGKSLSYTWTDPGGRTLGMNLGWFQSGMTMKAAEPSFGFEPDAGGQLAQPGR